MSLTVPPFAQPSEPFTPDEHREVAARAYFAWRKYLSENQIQEVVELMTTKQAPMPRPKATRLGRKQSVRRRVTKQEHDKFMKRLYGQHKTSQRRVRGRG